MDILEAIGARHSVRQYTNEPLRKEHISALQQEIDACNQESGLHIQLVTNEPRAFGTLIAHYGWLRGVTDYFALIGPDDDTLEEKCGWYGERLVLLCQMLGLNTCWVAATYKKIPEAFSVAPGEKLCLVIAVGYGENQGKARKSRRFEDVAETDGPVPEWFRRGVAAALLAPTAVNQQKFKFNLSGTTVTARPTAKLGAGAWAVVDLGIVKYHFEVAAGKENFTWA